MLLYNVVLRTLQLLFHLVWNGWLFTSDSKLRKFVMGQRGVLQTVEQALADEHRQRLWVHASSYGEYNVARPLLQYIQQRQDLCVVLTFFSSTGYEMLRGKTRQQTGADHVFYLPLDTRHNARRFLDAVRPERAVFMISEFWMNYLWQLERRQIPTFVVSALIADDSYLLRRWYGRAMRRRLRAVTRFLVLNERSRQNLASIGFNNATVMGDPLFDNALQTAATPYSDTTIEQFVGGATEGVFIAGSIHEDEDLTMVATLIGRHPELRFIVVPHEITPQGLEKVESAIGKERCVRHSALAKSPLPSDLDVQASTSAPQPPNSQSPASVLIIDFVGALARIYRYATWAYVGGGFTPYLHSVIEATVYGLPVSFGPRIKRKVTPLQMMELGIGQRVENADELDAWLGTLRSPKRLAEVRQRALDFARQNGGSTERVAQIIKQAQ